MPLKKLLLIILITQLLIACDDDNRTQSCNPNLPPYPECNNRDGRVDSDEITNADLEGKSYIDDIGGGQYVIISFYPDHTFRDAGNDNDSLYTTTSEGSWDLTGNDISISNNIESYMFREARMIDDQLSFLLPEKDTRVTLFPTIKPSVSDLSQEFFLEGCLSCTLSFYSNFRGTSSGDDGGDFPFSWEYLGDGSVEINYDIGLGSVQYFFSGVSTNSLNFIGLHRYSDEPNHYIESGRLVSFNSGTIDPQTEDFLFLIDQTNLNENSFPWDGSAHGKLKRWDYESQLIPVKTNGSALAEEAMNQIESKLGVTLFDRVSISNKNDSEIDSGLIVSEGSAIGPGGAVDRNTCGHVSGGQSTTSFPSDFYNLDGEIDTRLYIHLSSSMCSASLNVATHEFAHALGMMGHFEGFGIGPAISEEFWVVLFNLYHNEIGATKGQITIFDQN